MSTIAYHVEHTANRIYVVAVVGGVEYYIGREPDGRWGVATRRKALGRWNIGGFRAFDSLAEMADCGKRYAMLANLVADVHADLAISRAQEAA